MCKVLSASPAHLQKQPTRRSPSGPKYVHNCLWQRTRVSTRAVARRSFFSGAVVTHSSSEIRIVNTTHHCEQSASIVIANYAKTILVRDRIVGGRPGVGQFRPFQLVVVPPLAV